MSINCNNRCQRGTICEGRGWILNKLVNRCMNYDVRWVIQIYEHVRGRGTNLVREI